MNIIKMLGYLVVDYWHNGDIVDRVSLTVALLVLLVLINTPLILLLNR